MALERDRSLISRPVFYGLVGLLALCGLVYLLGGVLAPILLAFLLAYAFDPLVGFLERHRWPRALGSSLCLLLLVLLAAGLLALILPALNQEVRGVAGKLPAYLEKIERSAIPWLQTTLGIELPTTLAETLDSARQELSGRVQELAGPMGSLLKGVLSSALALLASLIYVILVPLFTFYFLDDFPRIVAWFKELVPPRHRAQANTLLNEVDEVLAGFIRGQLTVVAILALVYSVALAILGVPAAITIGVVTGLFNLVPYLGLATGLLLSSLFLLLEGAPWTSFVLVGALFALVSVADGLFLTPRILGKRLGLAPVVVILAILAFGEVFGFVGVLLAVPLAAVGKVLGRHALAAYRKSRAFRGEPGAMSDPPQGAPP
jgi:predicted PurR-regulated permease PerM